MAVDAESRWLLRALTYGLVLLFVAVAVAGIALGWPAETVGNGYQLLGLLIAALGIPVTSPWLARVEVRIASAQDATTKWIAVKWRATKHLLARVFRRSRSVTVHAVSGTAHASGGASGTLTIARADAETADVRLLLVRHDREIVELDGRVGALERARGSDRAETQRGIDSLRTELQQHVLLVTREGWHYIVSGAAVTAIGIVITLAA